MVSFLLSSLLFSANIVLPSFILIALGRLITLRGLATYAEMDKVAKLTFTYLLSTKIFNDLATNDPSSFSNYPMVLFCFIMIVTLFAVTWFIAARTLKKKESVGSFVQSCFRCSFTVLGLSMVDSFAGSEGVAKCGLLLAMTVVVFNILASIVLAKHDSTAGRGENFRKAALSIVKNPLIIACVLGVLFSTLRIRLPDILQKPLTSLGDTAAPLSLLCIGSSLSLDRVKSSFKYSFIAACVKTWGMALIVIPLAILVGFRGFDLTVIAIFFTAANPSANYVMALSTGNDADLAATGIVISTILCVFTSMLAITVLRIAGLV